jgi:signal peptidase I
MKKETAIDTLLDLLKKGNSAEISASGYSMFPTLRPGDRVLVNPITENISPVPGDILIIKADNILVLHRLIEIRKNEEGNKVFFTRGDSMNESDPAVTGDQIVGIANSFTRNNKQRLLRSRIPAKRGYKFNRGMLWIWGKVKRVKSKVVNL